MLFDHIMVERGGSADYLEQLFAADGLEADRPQWPALDKFFSGGPAGAVERTKSSGLSGGRGPPFTQLKPEANLKEASSCDVDAPFRSSAYVEVQEWVRGARSTAAILCTQRQYCFGRAWKQRGC